MKRGVLVWLFTIFMLLLLTVLGLFLVRPMVRERQRQAYMECLLASMERGEHRITLPRIPTVSGAENAFLELGLTASTNEAGEIIACAVLEIPSIDLKMPVAEGTDTYALRVAAVRCPNSAAIGSMGTCVICGHSMKSSQWQLNRLNELKVGDELTVCNISGDRSLYVVRKSEVIKQEDMPDVLKAHSENAELILVSDLPAGVGSHCLLVYANLDTSVG